MQRSRVQARVVGSSARAVGRVGLWTRVLVVTAVGFWLRWARLNFIIGPRFVSAGRGLNRWAERFWIAGFSSSPDF